jgi:hypothetical protein
MILFPFMIFAAKYSRDPIEGAVVLATICLFQIACLVFEVK